jgi:hypothetical protein
MYNIECALVHLRGSYVLLLGGSRLFYMNPVDISFSAVCVHPIGSLGVPAIRSNTVIQFGAQGSIPEENGKQKSEGEGAYVS